MATIPDSELKLLSRTSVSSFVFEKAVGNGLLKHIPKDATDGHELKVAYVDASALGTHAGVETEGGALISTVPTISSRTFPIKRVSALLETNTVSQASFSNANDAVETQIEIKRRAVRSLVADKLFYGDSATAGEFDGLQKLATSYGNEIAASQDAPDGGAVMAGELERLRGTLRVDDDAEVVFVMNRRAMQHLTGGAYQNNIDWQESDRFGFAPRFGDIWTIFDDAIKLTETHGTGTNLTSIYAVSFKPGDGVALIYPESDGSEPTTRELGPAPDATAGKDRRIIGTEVGLAVYNAGAVARMQGVNWQICV